MVVKGKVSTRAERTRTGNVLDYRADPPLAVFEARSNSHSVGVDRQPYGTWYHRLATQTETRHERR